MIQFLPAILALAKEIPAVKRLLDKVPEPAKEIAASVLTTKLAENGIRNLTHPMTAGDVEIVSEITTAYEADILSYATANMTEARGMYTHENGSREQADQMADWIMERNLWYIAILILALVHQGEWRTRCYLCCYRCCA